jgi:hypothetical protein
MSKKILLIYICPFTIVFFLGLSKFIREVILKKLNILPVFHEQDHPLSILFDFVMVYLAYLFSIFCLLPWLVKKFF